MALGCRPWVNSVWHGSENPRRPAIRTVLSGLFRVPRWLAIMVTGRMAGSLSPRSWCSSLHLCLVMPCATLPTVQILLFMRMKCIMRSETFCGRPISRLLGYAVSGPLYGSANTPGPESVVATPNVRGLGSRVVGLLVPMEAVPSIWGLTRGNLRDLTLS